MTITGKVFLFLTLILAVLFPALAQPVLQYRAANQKALIAERTKLEGSFDGDKKSPGLLQEIEELERKRAQVKRQVKLEEERRVAGETEARKLRQAKETELVFLRDALADAEIRASTLKSDLAQTDQEINARDAEIKEMDAEVRQATALSMELAQQVADLKARLETAKTETQKLLAQLQDQERELAAIMRRQPDQEGDVASAGR